MSKNCPKCGAFMAYDAYYARWTCRQQWCDGQWTPPAVDTSATTAADLRGVFEHPSPAPSPKERKP